jgi:hypothetical protein
MQVFSPSGCSLVGRPSSISVVGDSLSGDGAAQQFYDITQRELGWMASVFGRGENDRSQAALTLLDPLEPVERAAIRDVELRREIFATLLARKREDVIAPEAGADPDFDRLLAGEKWAGDPLFLMMARLVAGEVGGMKDTLALSRADLAEKIARRELDRVGARFLTANLPSGPIAPVAETGKPRGVAKDRIPNVS